MIPQKGLRTSTDDSEVNLNQMKKYSLLAAERRGLRVLLFHEMKRPVDHSKYLDRSTGRFIMEYGSLEKVKGPVCFDLPLLRRINQKPDNQW